jgi:SH3-like domain-containing protein
MFLRAARVCCAVSLLLSATAIGALAAPRRSAHGPHRIPVLFVPPLPPAARTASPPHPETATNARPSPPPADLDKGSVTGLPLPRFASLRADVVNLRAGPGTRYPIDWIYKRVGMPVEILREFDVWRLVETPDGEKGWMHEATLMGRRDFMVTDERHTVRVKPEATAPAVAILEPGVIGHIRNCKLGDAWCRVDVGNYSGWLPRADMWGVRTNEAVSP